MVARFEPVLREKGAWMYPRLFWESGVLGQVLYLEAHAVGISATGIGCYFDDAGMSFLHLCNFMFYMLWLKYYIAIQAKKGKADLLIFFSREQYYSYLLLPRIV